MFGVCIQCARGGCAFFYCRNRGAPAYRALAPACSPAPTTPSILNYTGFRAHPSNPGFLALCLPSQFCITCAIHSKPQLKWISVRPRGPCQLFFQTAGLGHWKPRAEAWDIELALRSWRLARRRARTGTSQVHRFFASPLGSAQKSTTTSVVYLYCLTAERS